jgi:hypothetical protein
MPIISYSLDFEQPYLVIFEVEGLSSLSQWHYVHALTVAT